MSCFTMSSAPSRMSRGKNNSWRWWRKCAGLAAAARSRLRRSVVRARWASAPGNLGGRRVHTPLLSVQRIGHHRSFAPVYVDQLYSQQPKSLSVVHEEEEPQPSTGKPAPAAAAAGDTTRAGGYKARVGAAAAAGGSKARAAAAAGRSVLLSPMRGGRGVGNEMGEVDVRAEMFIRKFREEMRLQSQRSAEEFQAMLARGL